MRPLNKLTYEIWLRGKSLVEVNSLSEIEEYLCSIGLRLKELHQVKIYVYQGNDIVHELIPKHIQFLETEKQMVNDETLFINFREYK